MYDAIQLGPFTIQYILLIYLCSIIATYFILDAFIPHSKIKTFYKEEYFTFWFVLFITYKFSIVLFEPQLLLTTRWLFFTGGKDGFYLGFLAGVLFLIWKMRKVSIQLKEFIKSLIIIIVSFTVVFQLIKFVVLSFL
ncbi:hypothetical protein [Metabacillus niabensis]|uniref:hypothetical protein n=1 Tax=Metabacillus niabensis TaxID=324854 RepID=UPI001CFC157F|nr:hypothetical protein [Metabacillus niabensis]